METVVEPGGARAIFIDIDGTLAHHGSVPPGHTRVVRQARAAGHSLWVCTGRPWSLIPQAVHDIGFDGVVAGAGAHVVWGDTVLSDRRFPAALAARVVETLEAARSLYFVEAPEATYAHPDTIGMLLAHADAEADARPDMAAGTRRVAQRLTPHTDPREVSFAKITSIGGEVPLVAIASRIGPEVSAIGSSLEGLGPGAGELYMTGVHKAVGMELALAAMGMSAADAVAIGDGPNDVEMLDYAGTAVAIATSADAITSRADLLVPGPQDEGLVDAFAQLGLTSAVG